jgi:hypothetical protein
MEKVVETLGIAALSKSQVSRRTKELDEVVGGRIRVLSAPEFEPLSPNSWSRSCTCEAGTTSPGSLNDAEL